MSRRLSLPDFREAMVEKRLKGVGKLVLVMSGKGGVGKSVVSATLSLILRDMGLRVGLLDADLFGPSASLLLGAKGLPGEGKGGLTPVDVNGVRFMSLDLFAPGKAYPLTGEGTRRVILEILALTDWKSLDCLIVDMPPATGDIVMTVAALPKKEAEALVVVTPDALSVSVARRVLSLMRSWRFPVAGVVGNMYRGGGGGEALPDGLVKEFGVPILARLPYDPGVQKAVNSSSAKDLVGTDFALILKKSVAGRFDSKKSGRTRRRV